MRTSKRGDLKAVFQMLWILATLIKKAVENYNARNKKQVNDTPV